jgi:putative addiction module killer protein
LYPNEYNKIIYFIEKTSEFDKWFRKLKDLRAKAKILIRVQKLEQDEHFGDCEPVGDGIQEMKINYAKGYRIYFKEKDGKIIVLLIGGYKTSQKRDIETAKEIWKLLKK